MTPSARRGAVAAIVVAAVIGGVALVRQQGFDTAPAPVAAPLTVPLATPPGVLLKATKGFISPAGVAVPGPVAYADTAGRLAHIAGAACAGDCRAAWEPLAAPPMAQPFGDWSIVTEEGAAATRPWVYKGHALYVARDASMDTPTRTAAGADVGIKTCVPTRAAEITDWCVALFKPEADVALPDGIEAKASADANGVALTDSDGLTLYAFNGDVARDGQSCLKSPCERAWSPLAAPAMARPRGAFTMVARPDGTRQWAYQGRALYTYQGDTAAGEVKGANVDPRFSAALIEAYTTPPGLRIEHAPAFGTIWTDANRMTFYGHHRGGDRRRSQGRLPFAPDLSCDDACKKDWTPFLAAADAEPSGYWTLHNLAEGARQWLYRGIPLYRFSGDTQPGDLKGKYRYDPFIRNADGQVTQIAVGNGGLPTRDVVPNFWRPAYPFELADAELGK
ncbi:MAG: hypothetical protein FJX59_12035 [Alphaproteobacteria bacterium]|nr:hypothetical protein [Alphaproteobacteria bacterium]